MSMASRVIGEILGGALIRLVDVGAAGGLIPHWRNVSAHLDVTAFDPGEGAIPEVHAASARSISVALHRRSGTAPLHVAHKPQVSSLFPPNLPVLQAFANPERFETRRVMEVPVDTLERQLRVHGVDDIDHVKLDVQGAELDVLVGAEPVLESVVGVELEVEFLEVYRGQPVFCDIDGFLRARGFALFDLRPVYWKRRTALHLGGPKGQIVFGDALYLRTLTGIVEVLERVPEGDARVAKARRCVAVCAAFGYVDYALEILARTEEFLPKDEARRLRRLLERVPQRRPPRGPWARLLAIVGKGLWERYGVQQSGGVAVYGRLGNA